MPAPRFTLVTPVFNGMPWLPETLASVDVQRRTVEVEHIVLDGGSTDGSREWLHSNAEASSILVFEPDAGQTDALVRGFARARGEIIGWLNADDALEPGALAAVSEAFSSHPDAVAVSGCCLQVNADGTIVGIITTPPSGTLGGLLGHPYNLAQPATFFRRDAYQAAGGLDRRLNYAMDVDLWMKLAAQGPILLLPDRILARFRLHPAAKSVAAAVATVREDLAVRRRHGMPRLSHAWWVLFKQAYVWPLKRRLRLR